MRWLPCLFIACVAPALALDGESAARSALSWLLQQQSEDHGWESETAKAVIAVSLANSSSLSAAERELTVKQLQINFLVDMWGRKEYPLTTGRIAEYVLAFVSLCFDVTNFHGRDLTAILRHHRGVMDYESAFVVLATCAAGSTVRRRSYSKLISVTDDSDDLHGTDTLALSVLALRCVADTSSRSVERHLAGPLHALVTRQEKDGGFGNFHSSLLAVQALRAEQAPGWNESAAMAYLAAHQQADGSFGNLFDTTQVLPVLSGRSLLDVADTDCHHAATGRDEVTTTTTTVAPPVAPSEAAPAAPPSLVNMTLWLWIGPAVNATYSAQLTVPQNTSLFDCLKLAAERDSHFEFSATVWPNGHYIHTIGGFHEQKVGYHFWLLYRLPAAPDPANKPVNTALSATGVDDVFPENGEHILFWYKTI